MNRPYNLPFISCVILTHILHSASAQEQGSLTPKTLPPIANPMAADVPAKALFGRATSAAALKPESIGFYSKGCLAGGMALPINGANWQAMRLSRNRNWGNPALIAFLEDFAPKAAKASGWPGLLIGDISQPRGGPMLTGHASHQIGLDADIWLKPMPSTVYSATERETVSSINVVRADRLDVDPHVWTAQHLAVIREAALDSKVQRIFVNAAIKRAMCRTESGQAWMNKVRPMHGHDYHFHVRLYCPDGNACTAQEAVPEGDGCDQSLDWWFTDEALNPKPGGVVKPPLRLTDLPKQCAAVLGAE